MRARPVRRLLDERPRVRVGGPGGAQRGDVAQATAARRRGPLGSGRCSPTPCPIVSVQALLEMARAYVALGDRGGARAVLRQANDIFRQRPTLGVLPSDRRRAARPGWTRSRTRRWGHRRSPTAELRLLPLLRTHLTFREIAERLYVSRHTVKTQAISIYRKFGVSSRSEAIDRVTSSGCSTSADRPADADRPMWAMNARSCRPTVVLV